MEPRIAPRRAVEERGALSRGRSWWSRGAMVVRAKSKAGVWFALRLVMDREAVAERIERERHRVKRASR